MTPQGRLMEQAVYNAANILKSKIVKALRRQGTETGWDQYDAKGLQYKSALYL